MTSREDRPTALPEARRGVSRGGLVMAAAISGFASLCDALRQNLLGDPVVEQIIRQDLANGQHRNLGLE